MEKKQLKREAEAVQEEQRKEVNLDHPYTVSSPRAAKRRSDGMLEELHEGQKRRRQAQNRLSYWKKKAGKLGDVIADLRDEKLVSENAADVLSVYEDVPSQLDARCKKNMSLKNPSKDSYSPQLRAFAMTLAFYSAKAYSYVRETFELALPSPATLREWYSSVDGTPGFTEEAFLALKAKGMQQSS